MERHKKYLRESNLILVIIAAVFLSILVTKPLSVYGTNMPEETVSFIPDSLVSLPKGNAVLVDKTMQELFVYSFDGDTFKLIYKAVCSTGKNKGTKVRSGDARTPEGIYFPIKAFSDNELSAIYGTRAFDLSYPNMLDRREGKNGNNIWLHGTNKTLTPYQSNGCIALENGDINTLSEFININETPIIIQEYIKWVPSKIRVSLEEDMTSFIERWAKAVSTGSIDELNELYAYNSSSDKVENNHLAREIKRLIKDKSEISLIPKNLSLLKHDKYSIAVFDQEFDVNGTLYNAGTKKLFIKKWQNKWYIAGDENLSPAKELQFVATLEKLKETVENNDRILETINDWVASWESGNMTEYASFYAPHFKTRGMNLDGWLTYKSRIARLNQDIKISLKDVKITRRPQNRAIATFEQTYRSSRVNDVGMKTLYLQYAEDSWKIYRENWK